MFLTITSIVVAVLFGFTFAVALRLSSVNNRLHRKIDKLKVELNASRTSLTQHAESIIQLSASISRHDKARLSDKAEYVPECCECSGYYTVVRNVDIDGSTYSTIIKRFTDEDTDFNRNVAEELCEILNS